MKKFLFCLSVFIFVAIGSSAFRLCTPSSVVALAQTGSSISDHELGAYIDEQLSRLDLEALQAYIDSLSVFSERSIGERIRAYMRGESIDYTKISDWIFDLLFQKIKALLPIFACIMAITLLSGIFLTLKQDSKTTSSEAVFFVCFTATLIPLLSVLTECFRSTCSALESMQTQMQLLFPILLTLMTASGGMVTASICQPAVGFFSTAIVSIMTQVVLPISVIIVAFSIVGHLSNDLKIGKFSAFFKSINKWIVGISVSIFGLFFTMQGITAASYDGIVRRAAKYAIGNGVPIIGGFLSGGFDLAVAGSVLIKNALGNLGLFLMLAVVFEPLVLLLSVTVLLRLTAAVSQPFGNTRISDFLSETADNLQYCTAGLLSSGFLYFLCIVLMICTSEGLL